MKIKHALFLCSCAMLLISILSIEPYEDEDQFGEIKKSMRNMGQRIGGYKNKGVYIDGVVIPLTNSEEHGGDEPLFLNCEKDAGSEGGNCGGHEANGGKEGNIENSIPIPNSLKSKNRWERKSPVEN
uniref:VfENOD-GRP2 n=1 Tax=Vicia faba TaxID=3906 RepID=O04304_VICFA|nr:VfENOD-GRP2 [Vicia faba]